jgi:hypothetical protein
VSELRYALHDLGVLPIEASRRAEAAQLRRAKSVMQEFDQSREGTLTEKEFAELLTRIRLKLEVLPAQQRLAGKWAKPPQDNAEPERTERLLARPFLVLKSRASDCQDSMSLSMFGKTSGIHLLGMCFQWSSMMVQVSCGVVQGIGPYITQNTVEARVQVLSVALVKVGWALIMLRFRPCACGLTNAVIVCQFMFEGISSILLFVASESDDPEVSARVTFITCTAFARMLLACEGRGSIELP